MIAGGVIPAQDYDFLYKDVYKRQNVDPWGGSYYVESLTNELAHKAWELIQEVDKSMPPQEG